jgi:thiol-disulfide isomerase/thioredoxin
VIGRRSFLALPLLAAVASCHPSVPIEVTDLDGRKVDPFAGDAKAIVFLFVATDCPISNRYVPEIRRLAEELAPRGVAFRLVYPTVEETSAMIREHMHDYGLTFPAFRDPYRALVARAEVTVTPESAVFVRGGTLVFHGRIDDRQVDFGETRVQPTSHDLEDAVNAVLTGHAPRRAAAPAIGCAITSPN